MTPDERERYARHIALPEVGEAGQERLKRAHVVIVGVGGLGSPAALYLAAAGVGTLTLVDGDIVSTSNLQRQIAHGTSTVNAPKVESARAKLRDLNPTIDVRAFPEHLTSENALTLFAKADVVIDATDNFSTRYLVNDACLMSAKPYVYASILRFEGQLSVFAHADGPCYRCLFPAPPADGLVPNCAEDGVLGVLPGILGTMQAAEALKLILQIGEPLVGRLLVVDALSMRTHELTLKTTCTHMPEQLAASAACPVPADYVGSSESAVLIDVRESHEFAAGHFDNARHIPLGELESHASQLRDSDIVLYCKSGARARKGWERLRALGLTRVKLLDHGY